jgi:hypothetical protein
MGSKCKTIIIGMLLVFMSSQSHAVRMANVRDAAEDILYSSRDVSQKLTRQLINSIDEPETDQKIKLLKERDNEESLEVINKSKIVLTEKINSISNDSAFFDMSQRVKTFLALDLSEFDPVPLSYLLEGIEIRF